MATTTELARAALTRQLIRHAATRWPQIVELAVRMRGEFAYLEAHLADDEDVLKLCRLRVTADPQMWGFALYTYSGDRYEESILPSGSWTGTPEEALDCACELYLVASPVLIGPSPIAEDLSYSTVVPALVAAVPELREDLDCHLFNESGILQHVFFAIDVTPFVIDAWRQGQIELVNRCLAFLERALSSDDPDTRSLVATSFVHQVGPWDPEMAAFIKTWPPALSRSARAQTLSTPSQD